MEEQIHFVIRLKLGKHPPKFWDADGREVALSISPGETVVHQQVWYKGEACVNLIGIWGKGFRQPMWVMTDLQAQAGLRIYQARMKIDESFRDLKSLLGMTKLMNKRQTYMEKMLALLLLAYAIGLLVGERLRDYLYGEPVPEQDRIPGSLQWKKGKKWKRYSGLFVLLKRKWSLPAKQWWNVQQEALAAFLRLVYPPVSTHV